MDNKISEKNTNKFKKILSNIATVIVSVYVIVALVFSISVFTSIKTGHPKVFGYTLLYIETDSMEGDKEDSLFVDDLVICKDVDYDDLKVGDIVAFDTVMVKKNSHGEVIGQPYSIIKIHRISEKSSTTIVTRGDNSPDNDGDGLPDEDNPILESDILGVYTGIRMAKVGGAIRWLSSQTGIMCVFVIPMALFFIYSLYKFIKSMLEYKMSKAPAGELSEEQKQKAIEEYLAKQASEAANKEAPAEENSKDNSESDN